MRKAIAIFFLLIHIYNLIGYKALFAYLQEKASSSIVSKLDKGQYLDKELVEMKVPYKQLYYSTLTDYERYDGEIDINGKHFNYVKRKFSNDTLYILCIPNKTSTKLALAKNSYDASSDTPTSTPKSKNSAALKCFSTDCNFIVSRHELYSPEIIINKRFVAFSEKVNNSFIPLFDIPPQVQA